MSAVPEFSAPMVTDAPVAVQFWVNEPVGATGQAGFEVSVFTVPDLPPSAL